MENERPAMIDPGNVAISLKQNDETGLMKQGWNEKFKSGQQTGGWRPLMGRRDSGFRVGYLEEK